MELYWIYKEPVKVAESRDLMHGQIQRLSATSDANYSIMYQSRQATTTWLTSSLNIINIKLSIYSLHSLQALPLRRPFTSHEIRIAPATSRYPHPLLPCKAHCHRGREDPAAVAHLPLSATTDAAVFHVWSRVAKVAQEHIVE
jgi:hypothetical protein